MRELKDRFWRHVEVGDCESCWNWTAYIGTAGYGRFNIGHNTIKNAQRIAWILTYGDIPDGLQVCHHCDNRLCCNPKHLFLGTNYDNVMDKVKKGRVYNGNQSGEHNNASKLTFAQVNEIRKLRNDGTAMKDLSNLFGISRYQIWNICTFRAWKNI